MRSEFGEIMNDEVTVVILTYNAGSDFKHSADMLLKQTANIKRIYIVDSSSTDNTVKICLEHGFDVEIIKQKDFGHGKTRQYALENVDTEYVVYMTQDSLLYDECSIENIVKMLKSDDDLGAVYGRQLPYPTTGALGSFARLFNYPDISRINNFEDRKRLGIKAAFSSDSYCAYRKSLVQEIGGFPLHVNFSEDAYVAGKLLKEGYKTGYCAEAKVYHAHDYNLKEEFNRYKSIGAFHKQEHWLLDTFGKAEGEGLKFVINEAKYLLENGKWYLLPVAFIHNVVKYVGYKAGNN